MEILTWVKGDHTIKNNFDESKERLKNKNASYRRTKGQRMTRSLRSSVGMDVSEIEQELPANFKVHIYVIFLFFMFVFQLF